MSKHYLQQLRLIWLAFGKYGRGFQYLRFRYVVAPRILKTNAVLSKPATTTDLSVHMMTGQSDFLMACWSLATWYRAMKTIGVVYVHNDGSLTELQLALLRRVFPDVICVNVKTFLGERLAALTAYPSLLRFRETYPKFQSKKLLDMRLVGSAKYRMLIDSDVLWFQTPTELEAALQSGVPTSLMSTNGPDLVPVTFKDGSRLADELAAYNSGITLYNINHFDWDRLQDYVNRIDYMNSKFTDQAALAYTLGKHLEALSYERYLIKGDIGPSVVARHYTNPSRAKFFLMGIEFFPGLIKEIS